MSEILNQWEAEALEEVKEETAIGDEYNNHRSLEANQRILALIDLVRKKDEALEYYSKVFPVTEREPMRAAPFGETAREALALTEQLKDHTP